MNFWKTSFYLLPVIIICIVIYGFFIEPYHIDVHQLKMHDSAFVKSLKGITVAHISDLHIKRIGCREKEVLKTINNVKPDIIFLTGDYVTWNGDYEPALQFLSQLKAQIGVWAVMGEYDYSNSRKSCIFCHKKGTGESANRHNVKFLRNSSNMMNFPDGHVGLYGIDGDEDNVRKMKLKIPTIILSHDPMAFDWVDNNSDVLFLSGDTHGGQIVLPAFFWKMIGYDKNAKYNHGLYKKGRKMMYVSRGIGTSHIPFRVFERPEIVLISF